MYVRLSKCKPNKKPRSIIVIYQDNFKRSLTAHDINDGKQAIDHELGTKKYKGEASFLHRAIVYRNVIIYIVLVVI